jgi:hypothetical protein
MLLRGLVVLILFALISISACNHLDPGVIAIGEVFSLNFDQSHLLEDGSSISFIQLRRDSRCPDDAICTWEGEAVIVVAVENENENDAGSIVELRIPGFIDQHSRGGHKPEIIAGYRITLLQLDPYPQIDHVETKRRYTATLIVEELIE